MSVSAAPLPDDLALCHEIIRQQADTIQESQRRIAQLEHQVEQLLRRQYGPRRESIDPDPGKAVRRISMGIDNSFELCERIEGMLICHTRQPPRHADTLPAALRIQSSTLSAVMQGRRPSHLIAFVRLPVVPPARHHIALRSAVD